VFGHILLLWAASFVSLAVATWIVPGIRAGGAGALVLAALVLVLANTLVRPILILLTLPLTVLSFGLFLLVINALMLMLTSALVPRFEVRGFGSALAGALVMAGVTLLGLLLLNWIFLDQATVIVAPRGRGPLIPT